MELDYLMASIVGVVRQEEKLPIFDFYWDGKKTTVPGAPFLLDGTNNSGVTSSQNRVYGRDNEVFQMAAEFLFLDFKPSDFTETIRNVRSARVQFLVDETMITRTDDDSHTIYQGYFSNRYSSFGLSFIKLNSARKKTRLPISWANR